MTTTDSSEDLTDRVTALDAEAIRWITRGRAAKVEAGRCFRKLRKLVGRGKWLRHLEENFRQHGVTPRTARRWMKLAREQDKETDLATMASFPQATDAEAVNISRATEAAATDFARCGNRALSHAGEIYRLPLHIGSDLKTALEELRKSGRWPEVEKKIVRILVKLCTESGVLKPNTDHLSNEHHRGTREP